MEVPDISLYLLSSTLEYICPSGAVISGLILRSGVGPHEENFETLPAATLSTSVISVNISGLSALL